MSAHPITEKTNFSLRLSLHRNLGTLTYTPGSLGPPPLNTKSFGKLIDGDCCFAEVTLSMAVSMFVSLRIIIAWILVGTRPPFVLHSPSRRPNLSPQDINIGKKKIYSPMHALKAFPCIIQFGWCCLPLLCNGTALLLAF